tara:strand:+ start:129 stop:725 length:597 start_codon:yes stop_codon:yes gene_type:complete
MIVIFDLKTGNISSIKNVLSYLNIESKISDKIEDLESSEKIILPGVGTFDNFMKKLNSGKIKENLLNQIIKKKKPFLGICLGMQVLLDRSDEGVEKGLGLIKGKLKKFDIKLGVRVPHMGINYVEKIKENQILKGTKKMFYFVHSYYPEVDKEYVLGLTKYKIAFPSIINKNNIFGVQFHPEKSQNDGKEILQNFSKL